jgi:hypothetical protein
MRRARPESIDLAAQALDGLGTMLEQRELDRGRAGIEREDVLHCSST